MRPIFHRHYRPFVAFKSPFLSLSPPPPSHQKTKPFSSSLSSNSSLSKDNFDFLRRSKAAETLLPPKVGIGTGEEMAQRTEKEETEFKVPETITLCVNNCGVIGNPGTNNMCQKCFNASTAAAAVAATTATTASSASTANLKFPGDKSPTSSSSCPPERSDNSPAESSRKTTVESSGSDESASFSSKRVVNRCSGCRRKVGLTGFRCRCGELFCAEHRYSDRHVCSYDYKAAGREAIARENPVVKAAKIVRV